MMFPTFLRFYQGYTVTSAMDEYAITFFALINSMLRLKPLENIEGINQVAVGLANPDERTTVIDRLEKESKGKHGLVEEVKVAKGITK